MASKKASAPGGSTTGSGSATNTGESPSGTTTAGITSMDSSGSIRESALLSSSSGSGSWQMKGGSVVVPHLWGNGLGSDQAGAVHTGFGRLQATSGLGVSLTAGWAACWAGRLAASAASRAVTSTCRDGSSSLNRARISAGNPLETRAV